MSRHGLFSTFFVSGAGEARSAHRQVKRAVETAGRGHAQQGAYDRQNNTMLMELPADAEEVPPVHDTTRVAGWMVVRDSDQAGQFFTIHSGRNRIGTEADMAVVVTDPGVMPWHATLIAGPNGEFLLIDEGSRAGTFLNGRRVSRTRIVDNDVVRFASTTLRFKSFI